MSFQRIVGLCALAFLCGRATAQVTWTGGGADANFNTAGNWSAALPNDGTASLSFGNSTARVPVVNIGYSVDSIVFQPGSPGFTFSSAGGAGLSVKSSITQSSSAGQLVNVPLTMTGASFTFSSGSGGSSLHIAGPLAGTNGFNVGSGLNLRIGGAWNVGGAVVVQPGAALRVAGAGVGISNAITNNGLVSFGDVANAITYSGVMSGSGRVEFNGPTTLSGANSYTGSTMIGANVTLGVANALPAASAVVLTNSAVLDLAGYSQTLATLNTHSASTIVLGSGGTLTVSPGTGTYGGTVEGMITGAGALKFAGAADTGFTVRGTHTFTGGATIAGGTLFIDDVNGLGTGTITLQSGTLAASKRAMYEVVVQNPVTLGSGVMLVGNPDEALKLTGTVTMPSAANVLKIGGIVAFDGLTRASTSGSTLTLESMPGDFGHAVLNGSVQNLSTINANSVGMIFGAAAALPTTINGTNAYVGIARAGTLAPAAADVISRLDKTNFRGAVGFDTLTENAPPTVFTDAIDLTGFTNTPALGSASSAMITGPITPGQTGYLFGNGGGALVVSSQLTGSRAVTVDSLSTINQNHLMLVLRNADAAGNPLPANDFTGAFTVTNSLAVLDSLAALPAGRTVLLGANGYLGYTEAFLGNASFNDFVRTRLVAGAYDASAVVGIDSHAFINDHLQWGGSTSTRWFTETIDLRLLGPIALGTTTSATLTGPIFAPMQGGANKTLTLVAARNGTLAINAPLMAGNVNSVVIGSATSPYAGGTVILNRASTYAGGTTLQSGTVVIGQNTSYITPAGAVYSRLGSGTVTVPYSARRPVLAAGGYGASVVPNALALGSTLQIGGRGTLPTAAAVTSSAAYPSGSLVLTGVISDLAGLAGSLDIFANTALLAPNSFTGGVALHNATLTIGSDYALGAVTSPLKIQPEDGFSGYYPTLVAQRGMTNGPMQIANPVIYSGPGRQPVALAGDASFKFTGAWTLNNDVELWTSRFPVFFQAPITGMGRLYVNGQAPVWVNGVANAYGGTFVERGAVIFGSKDSLPAGRTLTADSGGYIGVASTTGLAATSLQTGYIDRFDSGPTMMGTIGFDTTEGAAASVFDGAIDLSRFSYTPRLGSATRATLSGVINPGGSNYQFGGGGGTLEVTSNLVANPAGTRGLDLNSSPDAPLTLVLSGATTYSGTTSVQDSALIFAGPGALPTGSIAVDSGSYVGLKMTGIRNAGDPTLNASTGFLSHFVTAPSGYVGFEGFAVTDLNLGNWTTPGFGLATTSDLHLDGTLTLAPGVSYRFAGYKGGQLTVDSVLSDGLAARSVTIGDATIDATHSNPANVLSPRSKVWLTGNNTYTGGTLLEGGSLVLASTTGSALGTGTVTVGGGYHTDPRNVALETGGIDQTLANPVVLNGNLDLLGSDRLNLTGGISGSGTLFQRGIGLLSLSGNNTWTGGLTIDGGAVNFVHASSVGTGPLHLNASTATVTFNESSTVNGISGDGLWLTITLPAAGTLTINQLFDAEYKGIFASPSAGSDSLVLGGPSTTKPTFLRLSGQSTYTSTGVTRINPGVAVVAANSAAFGAATNQVSLNGGRLLIDSGVVLSNSLTLASGHLGGVGTLKAPAGSAGYTVGTGVALAPGMTVPGTLTFDMSGGTFVLGPGGAYQWDLLDAGSTSGGWDRVVVNGNLSVTATATAPFTFRIATIGVDGSSSVAANFDSGAPYSWSLLSVANGFAITGLTDPAQFVLDTSSFLNPNGGTFTLGQSGTNLVLNFNPIPEPSTYLLMLAGLGLTAWAFRRKGSKHSDAKQ